MRLPDANIVKIAACILTALLINVLF
jgi:ABC-type multidrug transport system permease subunit